MIGCSHIQIFAQSQRCETLRFPTAIPVLTGTIRRGVGKRQGEILQMPHAFVGERGEKAFTHIAYKTLLFGVLLKGFKPNICQTLAQNWKINRGIPLGSMGLVAQAKSVLFVSHLGTQKYRKRQKRETDRSKRSALLGFPSSKIALSGETFSASPSSDKFLLQAFKSS